MGATRVLVVDDSVVVRKLVTDVINAEDDLEVAGTAPNGRIALAKVNDLAPDVVTLDVEMPDMNGIEALRGLRASHPRLPVVMFSTLTERGAQITLEALMLGAKDYVTKPANVGSVTEAKAAVRAELVPKLRSLSGKPATMRKAAAAAPRRPALARPAAPPTRPAGPIEVVVVGVSTGGPNALAKVIPALPGDLGVPVLVVQHMPPLFTGLLAGRLAAASALDVAEAHDGLRPGRGQVLVAPGDHHLEVGSRGGMPILHTTKGPLENSCRPAADVLFRSAATVYGGGVLGVVLTGMGHDALRGAKEVVEAGGRVLAQDEATSVVWGMPGAVVEAGLADAILPLEGVADEIARRVAVSAKAGAR